jgi:exonuclease III
MKQINPTDMHRTLHLNTKEYTFFSNPQRTIFNTDHILSHKEILNTCKNIAITPNILAGHMD